MLVVANTRELHLQRLFTTTSRRSHRCEILPQAESFVSPPPPLNTVATLKMSSQKLGRQFILPRPCHLNFPLNTTLERRASEARRSHLRITSVHRNLYLLSARDQPKQRCFRFHSDCTLKNNADSGPNQRFFAVSHRRISPVTRSEMVVQGPMNLTTKCCRHLFSTSCRLPPKYAGHMLNSSCFASNSQSYVHAAFGFFFRFFSRSVFVPRPFFSLVTASRTRI